MTDTKRVVSEGVSSSVGMGGTHVCDMEGCNHFETASMAKYSEHIANHKVDSGHANCSECGEEVVFKDLKEKDRPTFKQVMDKLTFHPDCAVKFFKSKGFEVKRI